MKYTLPSDLNIEERARQYTERQTPKERETEERIENTISPATKKNGFYTKGDFLELCRWKSPRPKRRCAQNDEKFIHEVTAVALKAENDRLRIGALMLLDGVGLPTASVLLHFGHVEPYPILDFRALSTLNISRPPTYDFSFWFEYVQICRKIAKECGVSMRVLDRALWEFSKQNQPELTLGASGQRERVDREGQCR